MSVRDKGKLHAGRLHRLYPKRALLGRVMNSIVYKGVINVKNEPFNALLREERGCHFVNRMKSEIRPEHGHGMFTTLSNCRPCKRAGHNVYY
ncbi:hypothetical protein SDC9_116567 [bioreactor metagenome]|uniref:Uncharacterized protein n=1 Tax=bioreactor metagenome TaxID=1076179 RepID=A0A645BW19_9ZZZZ